MIRTRADFLLEIRYEYKGNRYAEDILDSVLSYTLECGPECPVRYMELSCSRKDMTERHPDVANSIVEGQTELYVHAVGTATMTIFKLWLTDHTYEMVAVGNEHTLVTAMTSHTALYKPNEPVEILLFEEWNRTQTVPFATYITPVDTSKYSEMAVSGGYPMLPLLTRMSYLTGKYMFFADVYDTQEGDWRDTWCYIDYNKVSPLNMDVTDSVHDGVLNVYPSMDDASIRYSPLDAIVSRRIAGISSKEGESSSMVVNGCSLTYRIGNDTYTAWNTDGDWGTDTYTGASKSANMYGHHESSIDAGKMLTPDEYIRTRADIEPIYIRMLNNYVRRYRDASKSVSMLLSESIKDVNGEQGWERTFEPYSWAWAVNDRVNGLYLTNAHACDGIEDSAVLRLSRIVYRYPDITAAYEFGVVKDSGMSQELSTLGQVRK